MNFTQERPDRHIDPRDLTAGQLEALRTARNFRLTRVKGGWRCPGSPLVTLATAQLLGVKRLVIRRDYHGRPRLEATATGLATLDIAEQRRRRA
jgi:hypothetical protein